MIFKRPIHTDSYQKNNHIKIGSEGKIVFKYCRIVPIIKIQGC